jgi:hypothetical protein
MADTPLAPYPQTPVLEWPPAAVSAVVNFIPALGGIGTLIAAIVGHQRLIGRAAAQFFLQIIVVGYIWSVVTGVQLLINASWGAKQRQTGATPGGQEEAAMAPAAKTPAKKAPAKKTATSTAKKTGAAKSKK